MDIRYHFIRELIQDEKIIIKYVESSKNIADIFTKAVDKNTFMKHCKSIGLHDEIIKGSVEESSIMNLCTNANYVSYVMKHSETKTHSKFIR